MVSFRGVCVIIYLIIFLFDGQLVSLHFITISECVVSLLVHAYLCM